MAARQRHRNIRNRVRRVLDLTLSETFLSPDLIANCVMFLHVHVSGDVDMDASPSTSDSETAYLSVIWTTLPSKRKIISPTIIAIGTIMYIDALSECFKECS